MATSDAGTVKTTISTGGMAGTVRRSSRPDASSGNGGLNITDQVSKGEEAPQSKLSPFLRRVMLQTKEYGKFLRQFDKVAPVSTPGAFAIAVAAAKKGVEKEDPNDALPPFNPLPTTASSGGVTEMPGDSTVISNEPSIDGDPKNPQDLFWSDNDYYHVFTPEVNPGVHGQVFFTSGAFSGTPTARRSHEVTVNEPDKYSGPNGGQGDFIVKVDPSNPQYRYANFMAFNFDDHNESSLQIQTFKDNGKTPLGTFTIVKHTDAEGTADFEDKNNMAVDPATGAVLVTNTRFFADNSGSQINGYFLMPKTDAQGNRTGDFDFLNSKDAGGNPIPVKFNSSSNQVQWSQPGFLPGSKPIVAYRDFTTDNIYVATAPGIAASPSTAVAAAQIGHGVEDYFSNKFNNPFNTQFRSLSAPQMAVNSADGSTYIVYDDAKSGRSMTYLVKSTDGGKSWSQPQPVAGQTKGTNGQALDHWMSDVSVDPQSGAVAVGFLGIDDKGNYNAYATYSTDGGKTWSNATRMSQQDSNFMRDGFSGQFSGDYTKVLVRSATSNGKTSLFVDYAHPSAYLYSDPKVRLERLAVDSQISRAEMLRQQQASDNPQSTPQPAATA